MKLTNSQRATVENLTKAQIRQLRSLSEFGNVSHGAFRGDGWSRAGFRMASMAKLVDSGLVTTRSAPHGTIYRLTGAGHSLTRKLTRLEQ